MISYNDQNQLEYPIYLSFFIINGIVNGYSRIESLNNESHGIDKIKGKVTDDEIQINQSNFVYKSKEMKMSMKKSSMILNYNDSTGYLKGELLDKNQNKIGEVVLYKTKIKYNDLSSTSLSHKWLGDLKTDIKKGYLAPLIREYERDHFKFEPIYFDYDQSIIKPRHYLFLNKLIRVIDGHSDLRIKVTGHTDSDGSDEYNIALSKKRTEAIIQYFQMNGLSRDKVKIDYKGEKEPVESNQTNEGKQKNRRVDFSFI
tara:strand:- start:805 stop:1575 length:771 start_codon:yes stop_codon:yes gene_type:complete